MPQNIYELICIFLIYSFFGWCTEVAYAGVTRGIFVNRGFLNGPYCPIYGCGMVIVIELLYPIRDNLIVLFVGSFLLTSVLEFFTGFILEKLFHNKWWDYSNVPFNIMGYVCLKFSICWGLAGTFFIDIIHPIVYKFILLIPSVVGIIVVSVLAVLFAADCGITVATILKLNKHLKLMDEVAENLHRISDEIGENIFENVENAMEVKEKYQERKEELEEKVSEKQRAFGKRISEKQGEIEELQNKYRELMEKKNAGYRRLMKAFPDMKSSVLNETLQKYKEYFRRDKDKE